MISNVRRNKDSEKKFPSLYFSLHLISQKSCHRKNCSYRCGLKNLSDMTICNTTSLPPCRASSWNSVSALNTWTHNSLRNIALLFYWFWVNTWNVQNVRAARFEFSAIINILHKRYRVQFPEDRFTPPSCPPFLCFAPLTRPPWRQVPIAVLNLFSLLYSIVQKHSFIHRYSQQSQPRTLLLLTNFFV